VSLQKPNRATPVALEQFHTHEYIDFLQTAKPDHVTEAQVQHYNVIDDSPIFDGVFKFCQIYAGASIHGAQKLIQDDYDIAINWAGGLHHAKKGQASGEHPVFLVRRLL
jgi:acetoin utilization deacetylase AcuC-like enzyme